MMELDLLLTNANLATFDNMDTEYGAIENGAIGIKDGKIAWIGQSDDIDSLKATTSLSLEGKWLTPGLIDCHTHMVFAGNRAKEFELRLKGASYEEIAKAGGGIVSTVAATRAASENDLLDSALKRAATMQAQGVTHVEVKSGYGLDTDTEVKMLKVAKAVAKQSDIGVSTTFLGAHAVPVEFKDDADGYIDLVCNEMIPYVAEHKLADAVDVFCESIGFSLEQTKKVFDAAKKHNIAVKAHAEQLNNLGGSEMAAEYGALSVDHIEFLDERGVTAIAKSGTVATLLPGAFYFLRETQLPPIEQLREHMVPMAIATDFNPGSSPILSLPLMLNMACTLFRLTPEEALRGVTINAAKALGLETIMGSLSVGKQADLVVWDIQSPAELCYMFGQQPLVSLYKSGKQLDIN